KQDDSLLVDSIGPNDADAILYSLKTTQTLFLDKSKKQAFQIGGGYSQNAAEGDEKKYFRVDLQFAYSRPFKNWKGASWNASLNAYKLKYPDAASDRDDTNYTIGAGVNKSHNSWLNWAGTLSYSVNSSTSESNQ